MDIYSFADQCAKMGGASAISADALRKGGEDLVRAARSVPRELIHQYNSLSPLDQSIIDKYVGWDFALIRSLRLRDSP